MSKAIVLTTDFSECARIAYSHAHRLAKALQLPIRLVHVINTVAPIETDPEVPRSEWEERITSKVESRLAEETALLATDGVRVTTRFRSGLPSEEIAAELELECAVGVMTTHGYGGFRRFLMGSVVTKTLRRSPVPLLVVNREAVDRPVQHILLPTDLELTSASLPDALRFARAYHADVELFHAVVPPEIAVLVEGGAGLGFVQEGTRELYERREADVNALLSACRDAGLNASAFLTEAQRAATAIIERTQEINGDLIIMPAHGYRGFARLVLGSVTEEVIRRTTRPVLVLKPVLEAAVEGVPVHA